MTTDKNPFFKLEDLHGLEVLVEGSNLTSKVNLKKGGTTLTQILEDGVWLEVPPSSCAIGHVLSLDIDTRKCTGVTNGKKEYLENKNHVTGVVTEIEGDLKNRFQVRLVFRQFSQEQWKTLLSYLSEKQGSVNQLIKDTRK